jgi:hypothetical protein
VAVPKLQKRGDYNINVHYMLALQAQGKGLQDAAPIAEMINLALNPFCNAWEELEEELSLFEIPLGEEIISDNLEEETKLTKDKGSVTGDTRWDQWAYGWVYNSDSGTALLCGNLSEKCVGIECMSKSCANCDPRETKAKEFRDFCKVPTAEESVHFAQTHEPCLCPRNYRGLPKGMEAKGALVQQAGQQFNQIDPKAFAASSD